MELRERLAHGTRLVLAADPGSVRLRRAAATTLSLVLALTVLLLATRALGQPVTVAVFGAVIAVFALATVTDRTTRERVVTTLLVPLPALASAVLAASLNRWGLLADAGFVVVLYLATAARRWGPRGTALGMVAFTSYFFVLFLHAAPTQLPALAGAVVVGTGSALLVRTLLLPARPVAELRRLTRALRVVSAEVLAAAVTRSQRHPHGQHRAGPATGGLDSGGLDSGGRGGAEAAPEVHRLAGTALMIEDWLDRHDAALHLSVDGADLSLRVFDAQLATEQLAEALGRLELAGTWPVELSRAMTAVGACLREEPSDRLLAAARDTVAADARGADTATAVGRAVFTASRAVTAFTELHDVAVRVSRDAGRAAGAPAAQDEPPAPAEPREGGLHPSTRAAIQVAVAATAATVVGELISPARWYWAVLAAFVVFNGTTTRGDILTKARARVVGTVAGVFAAVVVAAVVGGNQPVSLAVIVVSVFAAYYLVAVSSAFLVFFVTLALAMLYGLLGTFSVDVLELRVAETVAGAAVGMAAAFFVLPTRTRDAVGEKTTALVAALDTLVEECVRAVLDPDGRADPIEGARAVDDALAELMAAADPLVHGLTPQTRGGAKRLLRVLRAVVLYAHPMAMAAHRAGVAGGAGAPEEETARSLHNSADVVHTHLAQLAEQVRTGRRDPAAVVRSADVELVEALRDQVRGPTDEQARPLRATVFALSRIDRALRELLPTDDAPVRRGDPAAGASPR